MIVGVAAGSLYAPMTASTARWSTRSHTRAAALVSAGLSFGSSTTCATTSRTGT